MKKGRHRRFEEARALKRSTAVDPSELDGEDAEPCPECGGIPGLDQASWCQVPACREANAARDKNQPPWDD